jgi:hypothetical protein
VLAHRRWRLARAAALFLACPLAASPTFAAQQETSTPETFEKVDPYTQGKAEAIERAGYVSLGPFAFAAGISTAEIEQTLGGLQVLWVETAHFKLGSRLHTYKRVTDDLEEKELGDELRRLSKKLPRVRTNVRELDPWLRLHLYAQRLEDEYAAFQALLGVTDADFLKKPSATRPAEAMGDGPYLGCMLKFTVLLTERNTQLERFARKWIVGADSAWYRAHLPGNTWFFGVPAELTQSMGTLLDSSLHAHVATCAMYSFTSGFRGTLHSRPPWLVQGLALMRGRLADPRWNVFLPRDSPGPEDDTWKWEERVSGLVKNKFDPSFAEMLGWKDIVSMEARAHMTSWSRVEWLAETEKAGLQKLVRAVTDELERPAEGAMPTALTAEQQQKCLETALGRPLAEIEAGWRKWVRQTYAKK